MHSFISSGCSTPFVSLDKLKVIIGWQKIVFDKPLDEQIFDRANIIVFLMLHTMKILSIISKEQKEPHSGHYYIWTKYITIEKSTVERIIFRNAIKWEVPSWFLWNTKGLRLLTRPLNTKIIKITSLSLSLRKKRKNIIQDHFSVLDRDHVKPKGNLIFLKIQKVKKWHVWKWSQKEEGWGKKNWIKVTKKKNKLEDLSKVVEKHQ